MPFAFDFDVSLAGFADLSQLRPTPSPWCRQVVVRKPAAHRRIADTETLCNPLDRQTLFYERLEVFASHNTFCSIARTSRRRPADTETLRNPHDRQTLFYERLELCASHTTFWSMARTPGRRQPISLQPVPDRRRVLSGPLAHPLPRHILRQAFLQKPLVHGEILPIRSDGNVMFCLLPGCERVAPSD